MASEPRVKVISAMPITHEVLTSTVAGPEAPRGRNACHSIFSASCRAERIRCRNARRSSIASRVNSPLFSAFLLPCAAPDPRAPPCMRQRFLPLTAGAMQGLPERVFAPHRRLDRIGPVLRG